MANGNTEIRLGMIGCGLISHAHGRAAGKLEGIRFVACSSRTPANVNAWAAEYGCDKAYTDYREMLDREQLDGVVITTWPSDHREHIEACMDAGVRYILCEKALTISPEDAMALWRRCHAEKIIVIEGFMYRHHPAMATLADLFENRELGAIDNIFAAFHMYDPEDVAADDESRSWRQKSQAGGGVPFDFLCYPVDAANRFSGSLPKRVSATGSISQKYGTINRLYGWIEYENGCVAVVESSRKAVFDQRLTITCEHGELCLPQAWSIVDGAQISLTRNPSFLKRDQESFAVPPPGSHDGRLIDFPVFMKQMENFAAVIRGKAAPKITMTESAINFYVLNALISSFQNNRVIEIMLPDELRLDAYRKEIN